MKSIAYDCDGVLLNFTKGMADFLRHIDGIVPDPAGPSEYDLRRWIGVDDHDFILDRIHRFTRNEADFFANLEPIDGAIRAVEEISDHGLTAIIVTKCGTHDSTRSARISNIERHFGRLPITFLDLDACKRGSLDQLDRGWFIEDHPGNAIIGAELGHQCLVINHPYNRQDGSDEPFMRADDWGEIRQIVLAERDLPLEIV